MNWKQVTACFVAGITGGVLAALILPWSSFWAGLTSISAGEWLQAGAAIVGVALTVWATLLLERLKRKRDRQEELRMMREALLFLSKVLPQASIPTDGQGPLADRIEFTKNLYGSVRAAIDSVTYARQGYRVRSFRLFDTLMSIDRVCSRYKATITSEEKILNENVVSGAVLAIADERLKTYAEELAGPVTAALLALETEKA